MSDEMRLTQRGIQRWSGGRREIARIDRRVEIQGYAQDRLAELADRKREAIDWLTSNRIAGSFMLAGIADEAIARRPSCAALVERALVDREIAVGRIIRRAGS